MYKSRKTMHKRRTRGGYLAPISSTVKTSSRISSKKTSSKKTRKNVKTRKPYSRSRSSASLFTSIF